MQVIDGQGKAYTVRRRIAVLRGGIPDTSLHCPYNQLAQYAFIEQTRYPPGETEVLVEPEQAR
jgi:hypothetical protein